MNENETGSEHHPLRLALALTIAFADNGAIAATMLSSGIDNRLARDGASPATQVADLGTLPTISVIACRAKA